MADFHLSSIAEGVSCLLSATFEVNYLRKLKDICWLGFVLQYGFRVWISNASLFSLFLV